MLKMDKLALIFEEMVFSRNKQKKKIRNSDDVTFLTNFEISFVVVYDIAIFVFRKYHLFKN